jgi:hypothetical protein
MNNLTKSFSGSALLGRTNESALKSMLSGTATLSSVTNHTSKANGNCVKFTFDATAPGQQGHDEYLRTSQASYLTRSLQKLVYLLVHSDNEEAKTMFGALPDATTVINGADGQPIYFETKEELEGLRADHGEDIDFMWVDDDKSTARYCVRIDDSKGYCDQIVAIFSKLVGAKYSLKIRKPISAEEAIKLKCKPDNFQRLNSIEAS